MEFQFPAIEADFALDFSAEPYFVEDEAARQYRLRLELSDPAFEAYALGCAGFEIDEESIPHVTPRRPRPEELPGPITITRYTRVN